MELKSFSSSIVRGDEKTNNDKIENEFFETIDFFEKKINNKQMEIHEFPEEFRKKIENELIRINSGNPQEIFDRSKIIKQIIDTDKIEKRIKDITSVSVIRGYFTACKYFMKKDKIDNLVQSFIEGLDIYKKYRNKIVFEVLFEYINFKTGPLSIDDIEKGNLYFERLNMDTVGKFKRILESTGCYGISAGRGMGKSTLINLLIREIEQKKKKTNPLIVKLTIPCEYQPEEFLTVFLSKICEESKRNLKNSYLLYKFIHSFVIILGFIIISYLLPIIFPNFVNDYYKFLISLLLSFVTIKLSIFALSHFTHYLDKILNYEYVDKIYSFIKFKKTFEITKGTSYKFFSLSKHTTFEENPINYSSPLLSDKTTELIERITEKTFGKVYVFIDDFDKLSENEYYNLLKNLRFLSSTKNCFTLISVPEGFKKHLANKNSEVRTLFDQIIELEKIKDKDDLQKLIEHRIMKYEIGQKFSEVLLKDSRYFYSELLSRSDGVPREAIRLFNECFQNWYGLKGKTNIDDDFYLRHDI